MDSCISDTPGRAATSWSNVVIPMIIRDGGLKGRVLCRSHLDRRFQALLVLSNGFLINNVALALEDF